MSLSHVMWRPSISNGVSSAKSIIESERKRSLDSGELHEASNLQSKNYSYELVFVTPLLKLSSKFIGFGCITNSNSFGFPN